MVVFLVYSVHYPHLDGAAAMEWMDSVLSRLCYGNRSSSAMDLTAAGKELVLLNGFDEARDDTLATCERIILRGAQWKENEFDEGAADSSKVSIVKGL